MAATGSMGHSGGVSWPNWAENVGFAYDSASTVFNLWVGSPSHKQNMLHPGVTHIGVGIVVGADGRIWVTQVLAG